MNKYLLKIIALVCLVVGGYHAFHYYLHSVEKEELQFLETEKYEKFQHPSDGLWYDRVKYE